MTHRRILVAYDGGGSAQQAWQWALRLARSEQAQIHALAVVDPHDAPSSLEREVEHRHQWSGLRKLVPSGSFSDVIVECEVTEGDVAKQIVERAGQLGADLIVMGRGRDHGRASAVFRHVVEHAPCTVLVAPDHHEPVMRERA